MRMKKILIFFLGVLVIGFYTIQARAQNNTCGNNTTCQAYLDYINSSGDLYGYDPRQCVSYAAWRTVRNKVNPAAISNWGHAFRWDNKAIQRGYVVNRIPLEGAIVQWNFGQNCDGEDCRWGHVAYVEQVRSDGSIRISQFNADGNLNYSEEDIPSSAFQNMQFIHINTGGQPEQTSTPSNLDYTIENGEVTFNWIGASPTNSGSAIWRLDIIKNADHISQDETGYKTEASIPIPRGVSSIYVENGRIVWNYQDNNGEIYNGYFYFEYDVNYQYRIFNGKEYTNYVDSDGNTTFKINEYTDLAGSLFIDKRLGGKLHLRARSGITIGSNFALSTVDADAPIYHSIKIIQAPYILVKQGTTLKPGMHLIGSSVNGDGGVSSRILIGDKSINTELVPNNTASIYPNPSSDIVNITFRLEEAGDVRVEILDAMGRKIWEHEAKKQEMGTQKITWQGKNAEKGLYFVHILANGKKEVRKVMLIE